MPGTAVGSVKTAARRIGVSVDAYRALCASGQKWCGRCRAWHRLDRFGIDRHRGDGRSPFCLDSHPSKGKPRARSPEKERARMKVAKAIRVGRLPSPNTLTCTDCGAAWTVGKPRHEYDHTLGYAPEHALRVEAVCRPCHIERGVRRGEFHHG